MRALVAALVTASLAPVASASAASPAERFPIGGAHLYWAVEIGAAVWQERPCGGDVQLRWAPLEPGTRAEAIWQNLEDPWANPRANFNCSITLSTLAAFEWPDLCTTMVHEMGHLLGQRHSHDPGSVMYESAVDPLPICGGEGEPEASAATVRVLRRQCGRRRMRASGARAATRRAHRACQRQRERQAARR